MVWGTSSGAASAGRAGRWDRRGDVPGTCSFACQSPARARSGRKRALFKSTRRNAGDTAADRRLVPGRAGEGAASWEPAEGAGSRFRPASMGGRRRWKGWGGGPRRYPGRGFAGRRPRNRGSLWHRWRGFPRPCWWSGRTGRLFHPGPESRAAPATCSPSTWAEPGAAC